MTAIGEKNGKWLGGRLIGSDGYVRILMPDHPRAQSGRYVLEHVLVCEKAMGKPVPLTAQIHHIDENRANNANGNLVVCENLAYHRLIHKRLRALRACGDPNAIPCSLCGTYDRQNEMRFFKNTSGGRAGQHRQCSRDAQKRSYHAKNAS